LFPPLSAAWDLPRWLGDCVDGEGKRLIFLYNPCDFLRKLFHVKRLLYKAGAAFRHYL